MRDNNILFPEYADFLEAFRERMIAVASAFVLGEQAGGERRQEQVRNRSITYVAKRGYGSTS